MTQKAVTARLWRASSARRQTTGSGISGIAPNVTIVPIKLDITQHPGPLPNVDQFVNAFQYALQHGVDITNNSYGPDHSRTAHNDAADRMLEAQVLRDAAIFGRNGLGMINVFASGNNGGPTFNAGFQTVGNYSSSSYNQWANSRYVITVAGVDQDGSMRMPTVRSRRIRKLARMCSLRRRRVRMG